MQQSEAARLTEEVQEQGQALAPCSHLQWVCQAAVEALAATSLPLPLHQQQEQGQGQPTLPPTSVLIT